MMMCRSPSLPYAPSQISNEIPAKDSDHFHEDNHDMLQKVLDIVEELSARVDSIQSGKSRPPVDIYKPLPKVRLSGVPTISLSDEDCSPLPVRHSLMVNQLHSTPSALEKLDINSPLDPRHPNVHQSYMNVLQTFSNETLPENLSWSANTAGGHLGELDSRSMDLQSRYAQAYLLLQCTQAASRNPGDIAKLINAINAIALYDMQRVIEIQNEFPYKKLSSETASSHDHARDSASTYDSSYINDETHAPLFLQQSSQTSLESIELQPVTDASTKSSYLPLLEYKVQLMQSPSVPCFKTAGYIQEDESTPIFDHIEEKHQSIKKCQSALELARYAHDDEFDSDHFPSPRPLLENTDPDFDSPVKIPVVLCEAFSESAVRRNGNEYLYKMPRSESSISSFRPISKSLARTTKGNFPKNPKFVRSLVKKKDSFAKLFATATGKQL
ncbi:hypothetical protein BGW37DRAFT_499202 [Umbelopsis sp. PMI_123]|nr:hypothetical protein BGW37DRAFT_499202 [Umbelopsis sp. PMI_123]